MKKIIATLAMAAGVLWTQPAMAHSFWVLLNESLTHPPGHVTSLLGFGHVLPLDDLLTSEAGVIRIKSYVLVDPKGQSSDLGLPDPAVPPIKPTPTGLTVQQGDLGLRKIALTDKVGPGTYQVVAASEPLFFTVYLDDKGQQAMAPKPMDAIANLGKVISSIKYQSYAKAFFGIKKWTEPKALGHELEIVPLDDLSNVRKNDLVRFKVTYKGQPLTASPAAIPTLTCESNAFGQPDKFHLAAYVIDGVAQFRMPAAGQWLANIYYHQRVADGQKDLAGKCTDVYIAASVGFTVKP
ncbi:Nickel transport complex, NikM subunit, transmembrane [Desulfarculus baarsii DSM 2075]|uniref:Nickel transport complex, NikM subunit, transmembrane n=1 Tax=Desulfarculus baarsii (strain ATCC 33931 / DSM 2075 / LMG 7858 / VKM B-1802 / 2st14) TaxID=644282 RepID=E1QMD9_DESB2|nr:DUF4198 domain-containing protein [Desulfarculus baarsii]ADK86182.1 Nickel transport complex, NikM subunit, transmembrane [Desulfarculus baarsii DSM 2075]